MKRLLFAVALVVLGIIALSCGPKAPPPDTGIENAGLGIKLTAMPDGLVVARNEGSTLELRPAGEAATGLMWFSTGPEQDGVNLVAAVKDHQFEIENRPEAAYKGAQELMGPFGTAFYSRGQFLEGAAPEEETAVLLIHPDGLRLLTISYRYPAADDSASRVEQLISVLGYLE